MDLQTYHLRIHSQNPKYVDFIKKHTFSALVCFEDQDDEVQRDHLHAVITLRSAQGKSVSVKTWRAIMVKNHPELVGNSMYSIRLNTDTEANYRYVCKGKDENTMPNIQLKPINFNVEAYHKAYWEVNKQITKPSTKKNKGSFVLLCYEAVKEKYPDYEFHNNLYDRMKVFDILMAMLGKHSKTLDAMIVKRLLNGVMNKLDRIGTSNYIAKQIFSTDEYQYYD